MSIHPLPDASLLRVEGSLDRRFRLAMKRLTEGPEYNREFLLSDVTGDYWRVFTEYAGDISGRYAGAVGLGRSYTGEPGDMADAVVAGILAAQKEDGHFNLDVTPGTIHYPLVYGHGQLLKGLADYYSLNPSPALLAAIRRLDDWFLAGHAAWRASEVVANPEFIYYTNAIEGIVRAYLLTRDPRHLQLARDMAGLLWEEPKHHSHSYLSSLLGILALHEVTGEEPLLRFVEDKRDLIAGMATVDGGVTEMLPDKHVTEFCPIGDWFMLNLRLWRVTGRTIYLDAAERILYNALFFNQFCTGGFGTWHVDKANGYPGRVEVGSGEAYWCCCFHGARALYEALLHLYTLDEQGVQANLFFPGTARFPHLGDVTIRQETDYPQAGQVRLCVSAPEGRSFRLRVRVPGFARDPRLRLNGTEVEAEPAEGCYTLERTWGAADRLELAFGMGLRLEDPSGPVGAERLAAGATLEGVSFWWGPVLLGIDEMLNCTGRRVEEDRWTAPACLLSPPFVEGCAPLPRVEERLPVPLSWPGLCFNAPAVFDCAGGGRAPAETRRIVLTPLARVPEHQPACAPGARTRYRVRITQ